jgi:hypothetical protein
MTDFLTVFADLLAGLVAEITALIMSDRINLFYL